MKLAAASRAFGAARRFAFAAALACVAAGAVVAPAWAQMSSQDEASRLVDDRFFDCALFKRLIADAAHDFADQRGALIEDDDARSRFAAVQPLFGACDVTIKKKSGDALLSCQAAKVEIADLKATIDACLGAEAFAAPDNDSSNTQVLRYAPKLGEAQVKILVLSTFGKKTLAIIHPH